MHSIKTGVKVILQRASGQREHKNDTGRHPGTFEIARKLLKKVANTIRYYKRTISLI